MTAALTAVTRTLRPSKSKDILFHLQFRVTGISLYIIVMRDGVQDLRTIRATGVAGWLHSVLLISCLSVLNLFCESAMR
jgi:hypothetical protein